MLKKINEKIRDLTQKNPPFIKGLASEMASFCEELERDGYRTQPFLCTWTIFCPRVFSVLKFEKVQNLVFLGSILILVWYKRRLTMGVRYLTPFKWGHYSLTLGHKMWQKWQLSTISLIVTVSELLQMSKAIVAKTNTHLSKFYIICLGGIDS